MGHYDRCDTETACRENYRRMVAEEKKQKEYLDQYKQTLINYINQQIKRTKLDSNKKNSLQSALNKINYNTLTIEDLRKLVENLKKSTHSHKGKDGILKSCKASLFNPTSYREISKLFDENNELKNFKQKM